MTPAERVYARTVPLNGCLVHTGCPRAARPRLSVGGGRTDYAYRITYADRHGPIPDGLVIDHLCRVPRCVNPDHLEAVPPGENVRRGYAGENNRAKGGCPAGHPFDADNTRWVFRRGGWGRECRACRAALDAARYAARRASTGAEL